MGIQLIVMIMSSSFLGLDLNSQFPRSGMENLGHHEMNASTLRHHRYTLDQSIVVCSL